MSFPAGFVWGAAAVAYQIEGATRADGRGPCVWDMFCRKDGAVHAGNTADIACDHYHRWRQDVLIMQEMRLRYLTDFAAPSLTASTSALRKPQTFEPAKELTKRR